MVEAMSFFRKENNMKCPNCADKPNMVDKYDGSIHWWECPKCHRTVGKPKQDEK